MAAEEFSLIVMMMVMMMVMVMVMVMVMMMERGGEVLRILCGMA